MRVIQLDMHRVKASAIPTKDDWVTVSETVGGNILLDTDHQKPILRPDEARCLAKNLYRLARRVRMRSLPEPEVK